MSYYQSLLTELSLKEYAVDCAKCTDLFKCCTYKPFIANFLVGHIGEQLEEFDLSEWDFTICGIAPNLKYRKQFKGKSGWGFGTDATLLCSFYNKKSGGCSIWKNRPGVCRTFFCKSSYFEEGQAYWKSAEELTWMLEWVLLEDFLFEEGWTVDEVGEVKAYLNESAIEKKTAYPEGSVFTDRETALEFYSRAARHVESLSTEYIREILGKAGEAKKEQVLEQKAKLR